MVEGVDHRRTVARGGGVLALVLLTAALAGGPPARAHAPAGDVYTAPSSIDATGGADVTDALTAFLAGVPDGSTITFPAGAQYRIEGTLRVEERHDLTIEGNGARFFATSEGERNRQQWRIDRSTNIVLRNLSIRGANEGAGPLGIYDAEREAQHGIAVAGAVRVLVEEVDVRDVWGDLLYVGESRRELTRNLVVRRSHFQGSGRQGFAVTAGSDITFVDNYLGQIRRSVIDLEPHLEEIEVRRIRIAENEIGPGRFHFVAAAGAGADMSDITIADNRISGKIPNVAVRGKPDARRERIAITGNVSDLGTNNSVFNFRYIDGIAVSGNRVPLTTEKEEEPLIGVDAFESTCISVVGNDFGDADADATPRTTSSPPCQSPLVVEQPRGELATGAGGEPAPPTTTAPPTTAAPAPSTTAGAPAPSSTAPVVTTTTIAARPADETAQRALDDDDPSRLVPGFLAAAALAMMWPLALREIARRRSAA